MYILPPDMVKYESIMTDDEYRNIEIKLFIEELFRFKRKIKKIEIKILNRKYNN